MFNFTDTTFSGLLAVLSGLFGIAYPLVISCIEKIDQKYGSTLLTARFKYEKTFKWFQCLLVINLIIAIIFPFLMDGCTHSRLFIGVQACGTTTLIVVTFLLLKKIMVYYDVPELQKEILEDYHIAKNKTVQDKKYIQQEELYFKQWTDLTPILLSSVDEVLVQSVYKEWNRYIVEHYNNLDKRNQPYELYFYDCLTKINESLSRQEPFLISINNTNSLLESFIYNDISIPELSYTYLWRNLRIQLFYNRDRWIMSYWQSASQKYAFSRFREYQINMEEQKRDFLEFHIMLCAMILNQRRYSLLQQMLAFSSTIPEEYPLVPSRLSEIIQIFVDLETNSRDNAIKYEAKYTMFNMNGITINNIMGAAYLYLTLLIYRLYTINWYYGADRVLSTPALPDNLNKLRLYQDVVQTILYWIERVKENKKMIKCLYSRPFDSMYREKVSSYTMEKIPLPENIMKEFLQTIKEKECSIKETATHSDQIVENIMTEITNVINEELRPYNSIISSDIPKSVGNPIDCFSIQIYPREVFLENPSVTYLNIESTMASSMLHTFYHYFAAAFYLKRNQNNHYAIYYTDLLNALNKIQINKTHMLISFGINWDFFATNSNSIQKKSEYEYVYCENIHIFNFKCITSILSQHIYIMSTKNKPILYFKEPGSLQIDKFKLQKQASKYNLWLSKLDVKNNEKLLRTEDLTNLGDSKDKMSMLIGFLQAELIFKENTEIVCLQIKHQGVDEGLCIKIEDLKPITLD